MFRFALCAAFFLPFAAQPLTAQELAPGVPTPQSGSVFVLDKAPSGAKLVTIHPSEIATDSHAGSNFARGMVYSGPRFSIELNGTQANTAIQNPSSTFFVHLSGDDSELLRNRVQIVSLQQKKDRRVVSTYSQNVFGGSRKRNYDLVPLKKSDGPDEAWLKLTPDEPLKPGEYGIVFLPKDVNLAPEVVYDFEVAK